MGIENYYEREMRNGRDPFEEERFERKMSDKCKSCYKIEKLKLENESLQKRIIKLEKLLQQR